jgi:hypothetical protein
MKQKPRGFKRGAVRLDFDLYRVAVPIHGLVGRHLTVVAMAGSRLFCLFGLCHYLGPSA